MLRARVGQEFEISAGDQLRLGRVLSVADDRVEFELGEIVEAPSAPQITVLLSVIKFDRMEWAIEKLTELGVAGIVPLVARRTDAHLRRRRRQACRALAAYCPRGIGAVPPYAAS